MAGFQPIWARDKDYKDLFLEIWYDISPDTYNTAYEACNEQGLEMLYWLKNANPEVYENLYRRAREIGV